MTLNVTLSDWFALKLLETKSSLKALLKSNGLMKELQDSFAPVVRDGISRDDIDVTLYLLMIAWEYKIIGDADALDPSVAYIEEVIYGVEKVSIEMGRTPQYSSKQMFSRVSHLKNFALYIRGRSLLPVEILVAIYQSLPIPERLRVDRLMMKCVLIFREAEHLAATPHAIRVADYFEEFYSLIGQQGFATLVVRKWTEEGGELPPGVERITLDAQLGSDDSGD
jgi:hypothetical protein